MNGATLSCGAPSQNTRNLYDQPTVRFSQRIASKLPGSKKHRRHAFRQWLPPSGPSHAARHITGRRQLLRDQERLVGICLPHRPQAHCRCWLPHDLRPQRLAHVPHKAQRRDAYRRLAGEAQHRGLWRPHNVNMV